MSTFIEQFAGAFLGAGVAVALVGVLAYLCRTAIQHWLAKTLAEYSALIETRESNKRVVFERVDRA